jgi:FSR family fosmidomycin resistance protein-like MFS transporter
VTDGSLALDAAAARTTHAARITLRVLFAITLCHTINDLIQSLLPAIYPTLKASFGLSFTQIGLVTLTYQLTASLLQPIVGLAADRRPAPFSLPTGMTFTLIGLCLVAAARSYPALLAGAAFFGLGSSVFHPESSRVARMASGGRHGFAQSLFQLGGHLGSALGPLSAAVVVTAWGQRSVACYGVLAIVGIAILWNVGVWYKTHGLARMTAQAKDAGEGLPHKTVVRALAVLLALIFSKYVYLTSITNYYTFYLIDRFHLSVRSAQVHLFVFLGAVALGTIIGGVAGDRFGRKYVIWASILGALPFTLALPFVDLFWTTALSVVIGLVIASAFSAIVVYGQELVPGRVGMISGLFFGFSFGMAGVGAAVLGRLADARGIALTYRVCSFLPAIGLLAALLPNLESGSRRRPQRSRPVG